MCFLVHGYRGYRIAILCFIFFTRPNELAHCEYSSHFAASDVASTNSAISLLAAAIWSLGVAHCKQLNSDEKAPLSIKAGARSNEIRLK